MQYSNGIGVYIYIVKFDICTVTTFVTTDTLFLGYTWHDDRTSHPQDLGGHQPSNAEASRGVIWNQVSGMMYFPTKDIYI